MNRCIYTGVDDSSSTFHSAEHIFPKCIGGVNCLPKGWVSDAVNNAFSKLELSFARSNPTVVLNRMFLSQIGRKKHTNRDLIGVFENLNDTSDYSLGYIRDGTPFPINQIIISSELPIKEGASIPVRVVIPPDHKISQEDQIRMFWEDLRSFSGEFSCIENDTLPPHTYLLGFKDKRWYLGIGKGECAALIRPHLVTLVAKMAALEAEKSLPKSKIATASHQVHSSFSIKANLFDISRVTAKIALNCLAILKGRDFVLSENFSDIKCAILTGERISQYVRITEGPNPILDLLKPIPHGISIGEKCHSTVFIQKEGILYGIVSLFGSINPYMVQLGNVPRCSFVDFYICDWENKKDYTMIDCVLKICKYEED